MDFHPSGPSLNAKVCITVSISKLDVIAPSETMKYSCGLKDTYFEMMEVKGFQKMSQYQCKELS